ncbi:hypothetical protein CLOP_g15371 [Closterium sp. NIES-67]|nr:hypothetical protein CLOP_g15371 [Closterium sp. NIES-67]
MPPGAGRALRQVMKDLRSPNRSPARRRTEPPEYDDEWEDEYAGTGAGGAAEAESRGARAPATSSRPPAQAQQRGRNGAYSAGGNPRAFPHAVKVACWEKAEKVPGRDPDRWRRDAAGNVVFRQLVACKGVARARWTTARCYRRQSIEPRALAWT